MTPEKRALLDALLVERFTHLPQHPPAQTAPENPPDVIARRIRLVIDRRTA